MFKYTKTVLLCSVIVGVLLCGVGVSPLAVQASTPTNAPALSAANKEVLIRLLTSQLQLLQAQLAILQQEVIQAASQPEQPGTKSAKITEADYTRGARDARIKILTYSDLECPFCKLFHTTLNAIVQNNDDVSVTYRHFPLEQLHPNAKALAIAAECVGSLAGDAVFWNFTDLLFASREVNGRTDMSKLASFASTVGVQNSAFASCQKSDAALRAVAADMADGLAGGVQGTPHSFVFRDGVPVDEISGAQPLSIVEQKISGLLQ